MMEIFNWIIRNYLEDQFVIEAIVNFEKHFSFIPFDLIIVMIDSDIQKIEKLYYIDPNFFISFTSYCCLITLSHYQVKVVFQRNSAFHLQLFLFFLINSSNYYFIITIKIRIIYLFDSINYLCSIESIYLVNYSNSFNFN